MRQRPRADRWSPLEYACHIRDVFRIYDAVYIVTRGANDTETVSIVGYLQLVNRLNLGLGSAVAILIFVCVMIIAFIFFRFLGASPERR